MKKLLFIATIIFSFSCTAQEYPLNTDFETIPSGAYLKDTKNELPRYTGTWKAMYKNTEVILDVQKVDKFLIQFLNYSYYGDVLLLRYTVKDGSGNILQSTMNRNVMKPSIRSTYIIPDNIIGFTHSGGDCGIGNGRIYLEYVDSTHLKWSYYPESLLLIEGECPKSSDLKVYLPKTEDLVFTKQ